MEYLIVIGLLLHVAAFFDILIKVLIQNKKLEQGSLLAFLFVPLVGAAFYFINRGNNYTRRKFGKKVQDG